jgi:hypothetical protein
LSRDEEETASSWIRIEDALFMIKDPKCVESSLKLVLGPVFAPSKKSASFAHPGDLLRKIHQ